jgi:hypothetical protein
MGKLESSLSADSIFMMDRIRCALIRWGIYSFQFKGLSYLGYWFPVL